MIKKFNSFISENLDHQHILDIVFYITDIDFEYKLVEYDIPYYVSITRSRSHKLSKIPVSQEVLFLWTEDSLDASKLIKNINSQIRYTDFEIYYIGFFNNLTFLIFVEVNYEIRLTKKFIYDVLQEIKLFKIKSHFIGSQYSEIKNSLRKVDINSYDYFDLTISPGIYKNGKLFKDFK